MNALEFTTLLYAKLTRTLRYRPEIEWSDNSWTHNVFRLFELVVGRKHGIRFESATHVGEDGKIVVFLGTFEATIAFMESWVRALPSKIPKPVFEKVYIPVLSPVGAPPFSSPYLFAIAFDATAANSTGSTPLAFSQTCTGSERILCFGGSHQLSGGAVFSSVVYNSIGLTKRAEQTDTSDIDCNSSMWTLIAPATGANTLSAAYSGGGNGFGITTSYTGVNQSSGTGGATNNASSGTTAVTANITTDAANSFVVGYATTTTGSSLTGNGMTDRTATSFLGARTNQSDKLVASAGATSMDWTAGASTFFQVVGVEIHVTPASGPGNLKSFDGNVKANIKSYNGNVIANVKSMSGNA